METLLQLTVALVVVGLIYEIGSLVIAKQAERQTAKVEEGDLVEHRGFNELGIVFGIKGIKALVMFPGHCPVWVLIGQLAFVPTQEDIWGPLTEPMRELRRRVGGCGHQPKFSKTGTLTSNGRVVRKSIDG